MKILVAEDEPNIAKVYKISFEERGHEVIVTHNGVECLEEYSRHLEQTSGHNAAPFDVVLLDYRMPKKDGMEVAREILALVPKQRIIFVSAYVLETLQDSVKTLSRVVEMMQKPFEIDDLVSLVEDTSIWKGLEQLNVNVGELRKMNATHDQLLGLYEGLRAIQKGRGIAG
ncbi:response regulator with CheY-like receiver, AAA-type ATPase, and DNA-binding domains [Candidatus Nitrososphaera evergladensis SR1]|uniref:Response regulator with CheY-like receiver, AAA-type ATPase, and DNA-binding domains n=1 Tax=Candidatus Nitrososphaera evergladensis SR1 TaxID=1459636 RepID=A0A075MWE2_9ARCH|nr:response regulator [Candidatus Nitrososphaera evergladensis]AIF84977.1 response regulator with CheY-like receiver, AAA-type ATPase, and DNA-binding domains [Candidatus Nitrososphaera evergladensis SR1]